MNYEDTNNLNYYYIEILNSIPENIDFNFIPVKTTSSKEIILINNSEMSIYFKITNADSYYFNPNEGIISRTKPLKILITITPTKASVLISNAKITLDKKVSKIFKLSCVSKYPYLTLNKNYIDLGIIEYGKSSHGELIITNNESVPGKFTIIQTSAQPGKHPEIFKLSSMKGTVSAQNSFLINITYKPFFAKSASYETYEIRTFGGNVVKFALSGGCSPLKIFLSTKHVNFNTIELGSSVTKLIRVYNESDIDTDYQIMHSNGSSVFFIKDKEMQGNIRPHTNIRVNITFKPNQTTLFYERIFFIAKNHSVFSLDLYGSCHDLLNKTVQLNQKYIDIFRNKLLFGEFFKNNIITIKNLDEELSSKQNSKNKMSNLKIDAGNTTSISALMKSDNTNSSLQFHLQKEILWESTSNTRIISFSTEYIDFSYVEMGSTSQPFVLNVINNSNMKINIKWILQRPIIKSDLIKTVNLFQNENSIFIIQPEETIINSHSTYTFKVYFKPNKHEDFFYDEIPCLAAIMDENYNNFKIGNFSGDGVYNQTIMAFPKLKHENEKQEIQQLNLNNLNKFGATTSGFINNFQKGGKQLKPININNFKKNLHPSQTIYGKSRNKPKRIQIQINSNNNNNIPYKTISNFSQKKTRRINTLFDQINKKVKPLPSPDFGYFNPPFCTYLSVFGHSFPPGNQLYIPMYEFEPKKEIIFPSTSINQSQFQILKITNKSDTPLFYRFTQDNFGIFRIARKYGLIPAKLFNLILIEFCPKETTTYRYPLKITLNNDTSSTKTIILNGFCVDPVIDLEGIKEEIIFPPSFIGISTTKKISVINLSPINTHVNVKIQKNDDGIIDIYPSSFDMQANYIMPISISFTPLKEIDFKTKIIFSVERTYDDQKDIFGVYNPSSLLKTDIIKNKREYIKEINLIGKGNDGQLKIEPSILEFGTVKVGFHKKLCFSLFNPTITNFYIKLEKEKKELTNKENTNNSKDASTNIDDIIIFDFKEGLINSFCKKEISVLFKPVNRNLVKMKVNIYAIEHNDSKNKLNIDKANDSEKIKSLKCVLTLTANGDYPLIKIADVRNDIVGTNNLWHLFNVDQANEELEKQLTDEEINYILQEKTDQKLNDYKNKLKCITLNFGKHIKRKASLENSFNVYLTLRNEGGVPTEFYFKFPNEISICREIWMDPVEPSTTDKFETHVWNEKIFELEPKKGKLDPGECCNIRLRYNYKERGHHKLHAIFQVVNGKPLIFQLSAICFSERQGMLEIKRPIVNFSYVPIGYMDFIVCPLELYNVGGIKIKYKIDNNIIDDFNKKNGNFEIFKIEQLEGNIGPGDLKYIPVFFRPLTSKEYKLNIPVCYADESYFNTKTNEIDNQKEDGIERIGNILVEITGIGYHPMKFTPPKLINPFEKIPKDRVCNTFNGEIIQKCGLSMEEIDFGECEEDVPKNKTFIIYNYSKTHSFNFEFGELGFSLKDEIEIKPNKEKLEPNSHKIIKMILTPKGYVCKYEGELEVKINWDSNSENEAKKKKEILHIRIRKSSAIKELTGSLEKTISNNQCFIETLLSDLTKEILSEKEYEETLSEQIDNQPLGIFDWINDINYPSQKEVRGILQNKCTTEIRQVFIDNNGINNANRKIDKKPTFHDSCKLNKGSNKNANMSNIITGELYDENEDLKIQEKYTKELLYKYKLTIPEVNEGLALVNEDSRKLISNDIMECTVYNIIAEAVYGESDLSEKTRIYFFNK